MYYHIIEDSGYGNLGWHGCEKDKAKAEKEVSRLQDFFPNLYFFVHPSLSEEEPDFITV